VLSRTEDPASGNRGLARSSSSLRHTVFRALFWSGGTRLLGQGITWLITIVVIRLLTPDDYGLLALATVFVGFLLILAEAGLGAALVQAPELDYGKLRVVFAAAIVINIALTVLLVAAAPLIGLFFSDSRLAPVLQVLSTQLLLSTFAVIPTAILTRSMDFRRLSLVALMASISGSVCTLVLALSGYGVWSLIAGNLLSSALNTAGLNVVAPFPRWPDFSLRRARNLLIYGGQVTGARVLWYVYSQADVLIAGKLLGRELLGLYSVAMHLASLPVQKLSSIINQVAFPAFAQSQHDLALTSQYILKSLRIMCFFAVPMLWGISSITPEIIDVVLGPKWHGLLIPLQLLPLVMPLTIISPFMNTALQGIGHASVVFWNVLTATLVLPAAFLIGANWGLLGLSLAWIFGFPVVLALNLRRMLPYLGLRLREVLVSAAPSVVAGCGMYVSVALFRYFAAGTAAPLRLSLLMIVGAAGYVGMSWLVNRNGVKEIVQLLRHSWATRRNGATSASS